MPNFLARQRRRIGTYRQHLRQYARAAFSSHPDFSKCVVLFAQGRTGSTLLGEILDSHPQVDFSHEILQGGEFTAPCFFPYSYSVGLRIQSGALSLTRDHGADPTDYLRRVCAGGWNLVYLKRRNLLRHALSSIRAEKTSEYHHRKGKKRDNRTSLRVDPVRLIDNIEGRRRFQIQEQKALSGLSYLELNYEDDLSDPKSHQATAEKVFQWVGLEPGEVQLSTDLEKINSGSLSELIQNYEEVRAALKETRFDHFLEE